MKLTAVAVLKWNGEQEPLLFGLAADLTTFGFFQRGSVKEMLTFVSRTVAKRTQPGTRQTVQHEEYYCHAHNRDGLVSQPCCCGQHRRSSTYDKSGWNKPPRVSLTRIIRAPKSTP